MARLKTDNSSGSCGKNVEKILEKLKQFSLNFTPEKTGCGEVYILNGTNARIYIRGSKEIYIRPEYTPYQCSDYFLFGNVENGLYKFGKTSSLRNQEWKSCSLTNNHKYASLNEVVDEIKQEFNL